MFRDVPECSGMFRNVTCSGFYRRPAAFHSFLVEFQTAFGQRMHNSNLKIRFACSFGRSQLSFTFFQALIGRGFRRAERTRGCQWVPNDCSGLRSYTPRLTVYRHPTVLVKREKSIQCTLRPQAKHWKASKLAVVSVIARCCAQQAKDWKALTDLAVIAVATICYAQQDKHCKALQLILWLRDVVRNQLRTEVSIWVGGYLCRSHLLCAWLVSKMWPKWSMRYSKVSPGKWLDTKNDEKLEEFTLQCFCIKMKIKFTFLFNRASLFARGVLSSE